MSQYIISLDQGTSSSRAVLFNENARIIDITQNEFKQIFPKPGWVEHDPLEIWNCQLTVLTQLIEKNNLQAKDIAAIAITNQRETIVVWDKQTGKPVYNAIVWQDKRTRTFCDHLKADDWEPIIQVKTGLLIDSYFSATKIKWILDNIEQAKELLEKGDLLCGTIDSWLIWNLSRGQVHATDYSNASRTMLFNIETLEWDEELLEVFDIPIDMLPVVKDSNAHFADFQFRGDNIPILSVIGDQQAALFGQLSWEKGQAKNTYGTGCFMLMNTGDERIKSESGLLTTIAWQLDGQISYALEGSVFIAGAAIQWLRDGLQIIDSAKETYQLAMLANEEEEVIVVPAFAGLGAPYWDMEARGAIFGLSRGSGKAELVRGTLQSLAFQSYDVLHAMHHDSQIELKNLRVDGGAIANDYLAQFQADILNLTIDRPENLESTATGAAYIAGLTAKLWEESFLQSQKKIEQSFLPKMKPSKRQSHIESWEKAILRTRGWLS